MSSRKLTSTRNSRSKFNSSSASAPVSDLNPTLECLSTMFNLLKCVNCSEVPHDNIWTPGECNHKYCKSCIKNLAENKCNVCKLLSLQKDRALDVFSTNLLVELRAFKRKLDDEYDTGFGTGSGMGPDFGLNSMYDTMTSGSTVSSRSSHAEPKASSGVEDVQEPIPTSARVSQRIKNSAPKTPEKSPATRKKLTTPKEKQLSPKSTLGPTPEFFTSLFEDDDEDDKDDHNSDFEKIEIEVDNAEDQNADENDVEDVEIDTDLPVLTPHPLTPTRAMAKRAAAEASRSLGRNTKSPFKSPAANRRKAATVLPTEVISSIDIPVLSPHKATTKKAIAVKDPSAAVGSPSGASNASSKLRRGRPAKTSNMQPAVRLQRMNTNSPTPDSESAFTKPTTEKITENRPTRNKSKVQLLFQDDPMEIDLDIKKDKTISGSKDKKGDLSFSSDEPDSDSEFKPPKKMNKGKPIKPHAKKTRIGSASSKGSISKVKAELKSPFGIKPLESATEDRSGSEKRFFKSIPIPPSAGRLGRGSSSSSKRNLKHTEVQKNPFVSTPKTTRRPSLSSVPAFKAGKPKKNINTSATKVEKKAEAMSTSPREKSVYDFHRTQSQIESPIKKPLAKARISSPTPKVDDNRRSTNRERKRTTSASSIGSSITSSDSKGKLAVSPVRKQSKKSKKSKAISTGTRGRTISTASSNATTLSSGTKNSPSGTPGIGKRNAKGETPLHVAARNGQLERVRNLIDAGADVDAKDNAGWTPLHEAINGNKFDFKVVQLLCTAGSGCDVNALPLNGETPLHDASRLGLTDVVSYLLSQSASPAIRNSAGKLPRDVASTDAVIKILDEYTEQNKGQTQMSTFVSVELKISLQNAVFYFAFNPTKDMLKNYRAILDMNIVNELTSKVTHVILDCEPKSKVQLSREYLLSILNGCWMLSSTWLEDSVAVKRFLDPRKYEVGGCHYPEDISSSAGENAVEKARINREHGNPGLFDGMNFYLYKNTSWSSKSAPSSSYCILTKKDIGKLITFGSGKVINREPDPEMVDPLESPVRFHTSQENANALNHKLVLTSHIILYDDKNVPPKKYDMEHVKTLKIDWLIHSAVHFQLLYPDSYLE